jgi:hypothetical protein
MPQVWLSVSRDDENLTVETCIFLMRENTNPPPVVFCMLTGLQYVDRVSHHSLEHV